MPLTDRYVDAVTVGQAFHWFRRDEALREIHRVLRAGGGVALIWNARDERHPVQAALTEVIDPLERDTPRREQQEWRLLLADSGLFERCERALFEHEQVVDEQGLVDRVAARLERIPRILAAHDLAGRRIAQPEPSPAPLQPKPQPLVRLPFRHASGTLVPAGLAGACPHHGSPRRVVRAEADTGVVANV